MGLASLVGLDAGALGSRFSLVSMLPTSVATLVVVFVVEAGAPGSEPSWDQAIQSARDFDGSDVALLAIAVLVVAVILHPLQLSLVRLLEGYWGSSARVQRWSAWLIARQAKARQRLVDRATLDPDATSLPPDAVIAEELRRRRYPDGDLLPTALGNTLRAAERSAGRLYGMDAVVLWPRLYPVMGDRQRAVVEDRRDQLDLAARLSATLAVLALVTAGLLWRYPVWWLVPLAALGLSLLSYRAAVAAAVAYGESLHVTFDLHRFDLVAALHLPLPADNETEIRQNAQLSSWLRQGGPVPPAYRHPD